MSNTERVLYFPEGKIMKTIICDDEKSTCSELEEIILKYAKEKSVSLVTEVFYSGDTLLDYLKREKINILFLDIELPGKDAACEYVSCNPCRKKVLGIRANRRDFYPFRCSYCCGSHLHNTPAFTGH